MDLEVSSSMVRFSQTHASGAHTTNEHSFCKICSMFSMVLSASSFLINLVCNVDADGMGGLGIGTLMC